MNVTVNYVVGDSSDLNGLLPQVGDIAFSMIENTAYIFDGTNWLDINGVTKTSINEELSIDNVF